MTARSYTSETSAPWYTLCTGVVEGYQGSGMPTYSYPAAARSRGWFTDPDNQEFGEFCIWSARDTSSYLVTVERGEVVKRDDAELVYDGRLIVPSTYPWSLSDNEGGVEQLPFRVIREDELGWYRLVAQVANRQTAAVRFDTLTAAWQERTKGMTYEQIQAIPDAELPDAELNVEPLEHWYLTVAERIADLPDYSY
jgi:hypothetical protein